MKQLPNTLDNLLAKSYKKTWKSNGDTNMKALKRFKKEFEFADIFGYDVSKYKTGYNHHAYFLGFRYVFNRGNKRMIIEWIIPGLVFSNRYGIYFLLSRFF